MGQSVLLEAVKGFSCAIVDHMKSYIAAPPDVLLAAAFCKGAAASFVLCCVSAVGGRLLPSAFSLFHYRALGTLSQPGFAWWVSAIEAYDGQRASPQSSIAG
jgi:hypothetical protein